MKFYNKALNYKKKDEEDKALELISLLKRYGIKGRDLSYLPPFQLEYEIFKYLTFSNRFNREDILFSFSLNIEENGNVSFMLDDYHGETYELTDTFLKELITLLGLDLEYTIDVDEEEPYNFTVLDKNQGKEVVHFHYPIKNKEVIEPLVNYGINTLLENFNR